MEHAARQMREGKGGWRRIWIGASRGFGARVSGPAADGGYGVRARVGRRFGRLSVQF
jgi:hypothetical protein